MNFYCHKDLLINKKKYTILKNKCNTNNFPYLFNYLTTKINTRLTLKCCVDQQVKNINIKRVQNHRIQKNLMNKHPVYIY